MADSRPAGTRNWRRHLCKGEEYYGKSKSTNTTHCSTGGKIAETVLLPGDPLRAKFIADNFLTDVKQFNATRNMLGFTGCYNGKRVSVMGTGMGCPSIGIYSYELIHFTAVEFDPCRNRRRIESQMPRPRHGIRHGRMYHFQLCKD